MKDWALVLLRGLAQTAADVLDSLSSEEDEDSQSTANERKELPSWDEVPEQKASKPRRLKPGKE